MYKDSELPDGSKIKLIATDLDGTLLNIRGQVSEKTKTVVKKILEKYPDVHFVISTGRTRHATLNVRESLDILDKPNTESLLSNGCVVYDSNGKIMWQNTLPMEYLIKFHNLLKSYPNAIYSYTYGYGMVAFDEEFAQKLREYIYEYVELDDKEEHFKKILSGEKADVNKITFYIDGPEDEKIKKELEQLGREFHLGYAHYSNVLIEFMPPKVNKGTGLTHLINKLNISKDEVIAFGDGGNDIQLLQSAGWPVAMENACDELKSVAKFIAKRNMEDGVADILEKVFLK